MENFNEFDVEVEDEFGIEDSTNNEGPVSVRLERRRRIEDLMAERKLKEELQDY